MSERRSPELELRLNWPSSPVAANSSSAESQEVSSSLVSSHSSQMTTEGSCVLSPEEADEVVQHASAPETKAMPLVGCPRCLMYVMLSEVDPKCPKRKSTVFLDFIGEDNFKTCN